MAQDLILPLFLSTGFCGVSGIADVTDVGILSRSPITSTHSAGKNPTCEKKNHTDQYKMIC